MGPGSFALIAFFSEVLFPTSTRNLGILCVWRPVLISSLRARKNAKIRQVTKVNNDQNHSLMLYFIPEFLPTNKNFLSFPDRNKLVLSIILR
jgi:hypothetical protein